MATVDTPETPSAPRSPAPEHCPHCGSALRPGQEWCLTCGAEVRAQVAPTPAWRTPVALLAGVLALCAAALVVAFVAISDDPEQVAQAPATPAPAAPPAADPNAVPADPNAVPDPNAAPGTDPNGAPETDPALPEDEASPADPGAEVPPATGEDGAGGGTGSDIEEWPAGETAWTAIIASEPSRSAAEKKAQALVDGGTAVGVLNSDDYPSLNPGYWVVFFGQYDSRSAAESAAEGLGSTAPDAYARKVSPS